MSSHDWADASRCLADDVVRVGPFGDIYRGREEYLEFLQKLMPSLKGYRMELGRIVTSDDGLSVTAELTEAVEIDGRVKITPECLVFDLDQVGLIAEIRIYVQQL